jgi:hypothetical protein
MIAPKTPPANLGTLMNKWLCFEQLNIISEREAIIRLLVSMEPWSRYVLAADLGYGLQVGTDRA